MISFPAAASFVEFHAHADQEILPQRRGFPIGHCCSRYAAADRAFLFQYIEDLDECREVFLFQERLAQLGVPDSLVPVDGCAETPPCRVSDIAAKCQVPWHSVLNVE